MPALELAGPSGVGKSTIAQALVATGRFRPMPWVGLDEALKGVGETPFTEILQPIVRSLGPRMPQRRSFLYRTLWRLILAQKSPEWVVLDGGMVRRAHGVAETQLGIVMEDYYRLMPAADLIVFVDADQATIEVRNRGRGGDHDRSAEVAAQMALDDIAKRIFAARGLNVISVNGLDEPAANAERLVRSAEALHTRSA